MSNDKKEKESILKKVFKVYLHRRFYIDAVQACYVVATVYWIAETFEHWEKREIPVICLALIAILFAPIVQIASIYRDHTKSRKLFTMINRLEDEAIEISKDDNDLKKYTMEVRLDRELKKIKRVSYGHLPLFALQKYEYLRRLFERVLVEGMKEEAQYITLSSLGFWAQQPFSGIDEADDGRRRFIETNVQQGNRNRTHRKFIRRIVVVDKNLLLSVRQIESFCENQLLENSNDPVKQKSLVEEKNKLLNDKIDFAGVVTDFGRYGFQDFTKYDERLINLFYFVDKEKIEKDIKRCLATILVVDASFKNIMMIQTIHLLEKKKNPRIDIVYGKIHEDATHVRPMIDQKHDVKKIIAALLSDIDKIVFAEDIEKDSDDDEKKLITPQKFMETYERIFDQIVCDGHGNIVDNNNVMLTIEGVKKRLNI